MDTATLLDRYDSQLRAGVEVADAPEVTAIGPVLASTFPQRHRGFVTYEPFAASDDELDALVGQVLAHYLADERVDHVKWKTRGHTPCRGCSDCWSATDS